MRNHRLTENAGLKLTAFIFAILLWFVVVNVDDPIIQETYQGVDVLITNPEIVTNQGKVYQVLGEQKASVIVSAKRSLIAKLKKEDIMAVADLRGMDVNTYLVPVTVSIPDYEGKYNEAEAIPGNIRIKIEDKTKNTFPVTVSVTGTPRDGYIVGDAAADPIKVSIGGAESLMQRIDKVVARVNVTGMYEDSVVKGELILYDSGGNPIDQTQLTNNLGEGGVSVSVHMLEMKSVPLHFHVSGEPKEGYVFSRLQSEPTNIILTGRKEALEAVTDIDVPASMLDITGVSAKEERTIDITPLIPEGIRLDPNGSPNVVVTIYVEEAGTKKISLPVESIKVNGLDDSLKIEYDGNEEMTFVFRGKEEDLRTFDIANRVSMNLSAIKKAGEYDVKIFIDLPDGISVQEDPKLKVKVVDKKEPVKDEKNR